MKSRLNLLAASCLLAANAFAGGMVKLHGRITHPISDSISVRYSESWVEYEPVTIGTKLNSDGTFALSFPINYAYTVVMIQHGNQGTEIAPSPGDDLAMSIDAANFDSTLYYTGTGQDVANFMAAHMLARSFINVFDSRIQGACALEPDSFIARSHTSLQKEQDFLDRDGASLPESFKKYWMTNFRYALYTNTLNYPVFHEMQKQHSYSISTFEDADFQPLAGVPASFDDALLPVPSYRRYVSMYYPTLLRSEERKSGTMHGDVDSAAMQLATANMPARSAEVYEASVTYQYINNEPYHKLAKRLAAFTQRHPNSEYLPMLNEKIAFKKKLAAGSPAMDFAINTADGKAVKLSDLKGKVVLLDFWATWCGPCMGEMPFAKKMEEKYRGRDVVFLYVSLDADEGAWRKALDKLQIGGLHMRDGSGGWNGPIAKEYGIRSVPSFFLIDKNGMFARDVTPRPSAHDELAAAIEKLLEQPVVAQ